MNEKTQTSRCHFAPRVVFWMFLLFSLAAMGSGCKSGAKKSHSSSSLGSHPEHESLVLLPPGALQGGKIPDYWSKSTTKLNKLPKTVKPPHCSAPTTAAAGEKELQDEWVRNLRCKDAKRIENSDGRAVRSEDKLYLKLKDHRYLELPSIEGVEDTRAFSYEGFLSDLGIYEISVGFYEGGTYLWVWESNGRIEEVYGRPQLSPDKTFAAVFNEDLEADYSINLIEIRKINLKKQRTDLEYHLEPDQWNGRKMHWEGNSELRGDLAWIHAGYFSSRPLPQGADREPFISPNALVLRKQKRDWEAFEVQFGK